MAQAIQAIRGGDGIGGARPGPASLQHKSDSQQDKPQSGVGDAAVYGLGFSDAILRALGDESSRKILTSAIAGGKTVEEISVEQDLPLSTCYRRMRSLLQGGLMILERTVVTPAGKRYAIYRTSFSRAAVSFDDWEVGVELTPNMEIIEKLRAKWLSENYPLQNRDDHLRRRGSVCADLTAGSSGPFE